MAMKLTRPLSVLAAATLLATLAASCSDEQKRDIEGVAVKASIEQQTKDALKEAGIELDGSLSCSADIATDSTVTASCSGKDKQGAAIASTFAGTVDVDKAKCTATFTVTKGAETVVTEEGVDCVG